MEELSGRVVVMEDGNLAEGTASADAGKCEKPTIWKPRNSLEW